MKILEKSGGSISQQSYESVCEEIIDLFNEVNGCNEGYSNKIRDLMEGKGDIVEYISKRMKTNCKYVAVNPDTYDILGESNERNILCGFGKETIILDIPYEKEHKEYLKTRKRNMFGIITDENKNGNP